MTFGAPLARLQFPAVDRPSAMFIARFERTLRTLSTDALGPPFAAAFAGAVEGDVASCLASLGSVARYGRVAFGDVCGMIAIPDTLLNDLIACAFGGDETGHADARATPFGHRMAEAMYRAFVDALGMSVPALKVRYTGLVDDPTEAMKLSTAALACGFAVTTHAGALGALGVVVPLRVLAACEASLGNGSDPEWAVRLEMSVSQARVSMRAVLARPVLTTADLVSLLPGAVIPIPALNEVTLIAGGCRVATGVPDTVDGRAAIRITRTEFQA